MYLLSIMVLCCALNCSNRSGEFALKRFPADTELQRIWLENVNRPGYKFSPNSYVCEVRRMADNSL